MSTKRTTRPSGTNQALAAALNVSTRRVGQLLAAGMPDTVAEAVEWKRQRESGDTSAEALRGERIQLVRAQRERAVIENKIRLREFVDAGEVRESMTRIYSAVRGELLKLPTEISPRLEGLQPTAICKLLRDEIIDILTRLSDENSKLYQTELQSEES